MGYPLPVRPLLLLLASLLFGCAPKGEPGVGWSSLQGSLDAAAHDNDGCGGVLLRVQRPDGELLWEGAAGQPWRGSELAMDPSFTFEIASITKTFTAATTLLLVEQGSLELDAPLGRYLSEERTRGLLVVDGHDYGPEITLRQLLAQTSGLPDYWTDPPYVRGEINAFLRDFIADEDRLWEPEELIDYAADLDPISAPGGPFHYADTNYVLLGLVIEAVSGEPLHAVFRERLLAPLSLGATYLSYHEDPASTLVEAHRYEGRYDLYGKANQSADWAGGGLVSSAGDLGRFFGALATDTLFADPSTGEAMQSFGPTDWGDDVGYGLGLIAVSLDGDLGTLWGHEGYGGSFAYVWPEQELLLIGTVDQTEADPWPILLDAVTLVSEN